MVLKRKKKSLGQWREPASVEGVQIACGLVHDWGVTYSDTIAVQMCHGEEGAKPKVKVLDLPVDLHYQFNLWPLDLSNDRWLKIVGISAHKEFPS